VSVVPTALRPLLKGTPDGTTQTHSESNKGEKEKVGVRYITQNEPFLEENNFCPSKQNHLKR